MGKGEKTCETQPLQRPELIIANSFDLLHACFCRKKEEMMLRAGISRSHESTSGEVKLSEATHANFQLHSD